MTHPTLYLHLGVSKAASTYLQRVIFPKLQGLTYYPKKHFKQFPEILSRDSHENGPLLFSSEMFRDLARRARNIGKAFPDARVILVLRRQDRWLLSRYKYYLWKSGRKNFREFFDIEHDQGWWRKQDLYYQPMIEAVDQAFQHKPLVLLLEELQADPKQFISKIEQYTHTTYQKPHGDQRPVKSAFNERQLLFLRQFNQRFPYQKPKKWPRFLKQSHMNLRQAVNYLVTYSARMLPDAYLQQQELVPTEDLEAMKTLYQADWQYCLDRAENQRKALQPT